MKVAFAGFAHTHIINVYSRVNMSEEHSVVGAWEPDKEIASKLSDRGIDITYTDFDEMLQKSDADIVAVGACFSERGALIIKALKEGKHVIVDKPICTRKSELEEIEKIIEEKNVKLGCMLTVRYMGKILAIRKLISNGDIGDIKTINYGQQHPLLYDSRPKWYFEKGKHGGVINDIGIHGIDLIRFVSGLTPSKVLAARCWNAFAPAETGFKDCAQYMVELSNGAGLLADVSYSVPSGIGYNFPTHWEIFGTKGVIRFSLQKPATEVFFYDSKEAFFLEDLPVDRNYWQDFLDDIEGKEGGILCTEEIIKSTRDTIMIQEFADMYENKYDLRGMF